jgi:hypothetical protein
VDLFSPDVDIHLEAIGFQETTIHGRDELLQAILAARSTQQGAKIELIDIQVKVDPGKRTALAYLTAKGQLSGQREFVAQEFKITLQKQDKRWIITQVEAFRGLGASPVKPWQPLLILAFCRWTNRSF